MGKGRIGMLGLCVCLCIILSSCSGNTTKVPDIGTITSVPITDLQNPTEQQNPTNQQTAVYPDEVLPIDGAADKQASNLQKLCKVWGFAKYTHKSFLMGLKDWDEELLVLIPIVQAAEHNEVNDILYNWFIGLGDDGYNPDWSYYRSFMLENYKEHSECHDLITAFFDDNDNPDWSSLQELSEKLQLLVPVSEVKQRQMADTSWINDDYLDQPLALTLSRFRRIQAVDRGISPISFNQLGNSVYTNEKSYNTMDYSDNTYRLLGLFRLWNAIEYYSPYRDILDNDWNELLLMHITGMLEGTDKLSYELVLASITSKLHDAHINFFDGSSKGMFDTIYGAYVPPVGLSEVEGQLVVSKTFIGYEESCPLMLGDVILSLNGKDVKEIIADMLQYKSFPTDDKALGYLASYEFILRQKLHNTPMEKLYNTPRDMEIEVLRNDTKLDVYVTPVLQSYRFRFPQVNDSHMILENNIGLINPSKIVSGGIPHIMRDLANTKGLIVDLRQYPGSFIVYELAKYLLDDRLPFATASKPSPYVPGVFDDYFQGYSGRGSDEPSDVYSYKENVVVLMNEQTLSQAEFTVMSLRNGVNVTVIGSNSIGADGNVVELPLPDGLTMTYTGLGIYTPEGGQTQRIGLSPDIYVEPTIAGVRDGRDELMDAAIQYLRSCEQAQNDRN